MIRYCVAIVLVFSTSVGCAEALQNTPKVQLGASSATPAAKVEPEYERLAPGVKALVDMSSSLNQWALLVIAGALAVLLSTSYHKPRNWWRLIFFFLVPPLGLLGRVLERGSLVQGGYTAMLLRPPTEKIAREALNQTNNRLSEQIDAFQCAMMFLAIWLGLYMIWWIFFDNAVEDTKKAGA
jgi:MFS family permease